MAQKWADGLSNSYHLVVPQRFTTRDEIRSGTQEGRSARYPLPSGAGGKGGGANTSKRGTKKMRKLAT